MTPNRSAQVILVSLTLAISGLPALAQDDSAERTSRLEPQDCVTDALVELGAECYRFTGEEDWD